MKAKYENIIDGTIFEHKGDVYIKTKQLPAIPSFAVRLSDGQLCSIRPEFEVNIIRL